MLSFSFVFSCPFVTFIKKSFGKIFIIFIAVDTKENFFTFDLKYGKVYFDLSSLEVLLLLIFSFNSSLLLFSTMYRNEEK